MGGLAHAREASERLVRRSLALVLGCALLVLVPGGLAFHDTGAWQYGAALAVMLGLAIAVGEALRRVRAQPEASLQIAYVATMTAAMMIAILVEHSPTLFAFTVGLFVLLTAPRVLPRERTDRWVFAAVGVGLAMSATDLVAIPIRITPSSVFSEPVGLAVATALVGFSLLLVRELSRFPVRTKLILAFLMVSLAPLAAVIADNGAGSREREDEATKLDLGRRLAAHAAAWDAFLLAEQASLERLAAEPEVAAACGGAAPAAERPLRRALARGRHHSVTVWRDRRPLLHVGGGSPGEAPSAGLALRNADPAHGAQIVLTTPILGAGGANSTCLLSLSSEPGIIRAWARALAFAARGAVLIRDRDGASVAAAGGDMEGLFALPPVVEPGDEAGVPVAYGYYVAVEERHLLVVADARVPGWSLALMRPRADARPFADAQARRNHALALLAAALAVTVAFVTGHRIATPLARLTANLARFTSGDIDTRTPVESEDELGELAGRFNAMAAQVGNLLHSLEQQARRLRAEIAERTEQEVKLQAQSEALSEARDQALAANRAKSAFLARMSHELRTPLNAVIGYGELIQEIAEEEANEEVARDADAIVRSARHLLELINDVLDLSKIEAGRMEVHIEDFDAAEMIRDVTSVAQPLVERQRNQLVTLLDRDAIPMRSDRTKLRQCLLNLLSNAAKFTEDGTIEVRVRHESLGALPVIVIAVSDTGVGLDEEEQKRLFGAFSQVDNELTRRHGGTGLGLAITRRLCRKLGGDISVESARGVGTTFTMRLPLRFTRSLDSTAVGYSSERGRFY